MATANLAVTGTKRKCQSSETINTKWKKQMFRKPSSCGLSPHKFAMKDVKTFKKSLCAEAWLCNTQALTQSQSVSTLACFTEQMFFTHQLFMTLQTKRTTMVTVHWPHRNTITVGKFWYQRWPKYLTTDYSAIHNTANAIQCYYIKSGVNSNFQCYVRGNLQNM